VTPADVKNSPGGLLPQVPIHSTHVRLTIEEREIEKKKIVPCVDWSHAYKNKLFSRFYCHLTFFIVCGRDFERRRRKEKESFKHCGRDVLLNRNRHAYQRKGKGASLLRLCIIDKRIRERGEREQKNIISNQFVSIMGPSLAAGYRVPLIGGGSKCDFLHATQREGENGLK
jgi:hypothetical protein